VPARQGKTRRDDVQISWDDFGVSMKRATLPVTAAAAQGQVCDGRDAILVHEDCHCTAERDGRRP
jgi:hypothetical protein